jgi:hypothetical protein
VLIVINFRKFDYKMSKKLTILFLFSSLITFSQLPKPSRYEWLWSLAHPVAALKVKKITRKCMTLSDPQKIKIQLDSFVNGGKADAYRHTFFMAAYAQKIKTGKIRKLGIAHEKTNYRQFLRTTHEYGELPDSLSSVMDLKNNELGFVLGSGNKKAPLQELQHIVIDQIKRGKAVIMKRNEKGSYLDCNNNEIDLKMFSKIWNVPKCLVSSDK